MAHGAWKKARVDVPGLGRIHPGWLLVYVLVCVATVGLLVDEPQLLAVGRPPATDGPAGLHGAVIGEEAVPAMASAGKSEAPAPAAQPEDDVWHRLQKRVFREIIDNTIPLIGLDQSGRAPAQNRGLLAQAASYFLGFEPTDPLSLLRAGVPLLEQVELVSADSGEEVVPPVVAPATSTTPGPPAANGTDPLVLGQKVEVAIYSTHSSESFLPDLVASGRPYQPNAYTSDQRLNVIRVGEELARELYSRYGLGVVQVRVPHDADGYLGAYTRSATTVQSLLKDYPTLRLIIDLHRDSSARKDTVLRVDGRDVARVMLIIGSGGRSLRQPNWQKNYAVAKNLVAEVERLYPGLSRGIAVKADRYNQHLSPNAVLIEIGGPENSLDEELRTAKLMARAVAGLLKGQSGQTAQGGR